MVNPYSIHGYNKLIFRILFQQQLPHNEKLRKVVKKIKEIGDITLTAPATHFSDLLDILGH